MIAYSQQASYAPAKPTLVVHEVITQPLPHAAGTVHLMSMSAVLHVVDEPLPVLAEIRRVLAPGGIFLLHDWVRQPLRAYLECRRDTLGEGEAESRRRRARLAMFATLQIRRRVHGGVRAWSDGPLPQRRWR